MSLSSGMTSSRDADDAPTAHCCDGRYLTPVEDGGMRNDSTSSSNGRNDMTMAILNTNIIPSARPVYEIMMISFYRTIFISSVHRYDTYLRLSQHKPDFSIFGERPKLTKIADFVFIFKYVENEGK